MLPAEQAPPPRGASQTRRVLDRYAAAWGSYREVVIADAGRSPRQERPEEFPGALCSA